jgi:hypothetical protein
VKAVMNLRTDESRRLCTVAERLFASEEGICPREVSLWNLFQALERCQVSSQKKVKLIFVLNLTGRQV